MAHPRFLSVIKERVFNTGFRLKFGETEDNGTLRQVCLPYRRVSHTSCEMSVILSGTGVLRWGLKLWDFYGRWHFILRETRHHFITVGNM